MSTNPPSKAAAVASWVTRIPVVGILGMAGFAKVSGDPGSVYMFEELLGAPEAARLGLGAVELLTAVLLLIPKAVAIGAVTAVLLMVGAIGSHVTKLGISIQVPPTAPEGVAASIEGPSLFIMAVVVFVLAGITTALTRSKLPFIADNWDEPAASATES